MKLKDQTKKTDDACHRLLDAAEQLFADKGFAAVSVRDITNLADCNVAAVNYHFNSKDNLYLEVIRRRINNLRQVRLDSIEEAMSNPKTTLEDLLRAFSWAFLEPLVDEHNGRRLMTLMLREMLDSRVPGEMLFEEMIKPITEALCDAIMKVSPGIDMPRACLCVQSLVAQLLHTIHAKTMLAGVKDLPFDPSQFEDFVNHIVEFSAVAIRSFSEKAGEADA
ncbi:MAG: TetR/AcrR family transcriptional regulator [Sedimentisphaerales bacterium]|nr:TetR/AcrR family transcriptional regulator [Sedimentisphaerales bacterium]